ncbi:hypothetical protein M3Y98_00638900 [Aphelenchoides besseyi]|nr:hypothetical protein M3Y98_00638900 [Aphelenchoides besseyi]
MKELKSNQAAKAEKKRQRADEDKLARMDASKIKELREKLTTLRETVCNLEEEVEELEKKKPELQSQIVQIRSSIKEKRENEKMLTSKRDKSKEELEYRMEQLESLMKTVAIRRQTKRDFWSSVEGSRISEIISIRNCNQSATFCQKLRPPKNT